MAAPLIDGTPFTIQFVLDKVAPTEESRELNLLADLEDVEVENITASAFMSSIYRIRLHWAKKREDTPQSLIIKVPGPNYEIFKDVMQESGSEVVVREESSKFLVIAHSREISFYNLFPTYDPLLKLPKFYYGSEYSMKHRNGVIIMEDLTCRATIAHVLPGFTHEQVLATVDELARLHSASWKHPEWIEQGLHEDLDPLFFEEMIKVTCYIKDKIKKEPFEELTNRLLPILTYENARGTVYKGEKFGFPACFVHADLWAPNILWTKDAEGKPTNELAAIIDWQTCHSGNPCEDIVRVLSLNTTSAYRRSKTEEILNFYEVRVREYMDGKAPFTREQLREAYKHTLPFCAAYFGFGAPMYHNMDSVVGSEPGERESNQEELLNRLEKFFEDVIEAYQL